MPVIGRIPVGEFALAARFLDLGATGVIAPMINSVEDARKLVSFTKFPPVGERSWGPARALALTGLSPQEYLKQANDFSLIVAMIETREAIAAVDDILAVPGIDGVFVGPSDLSITLSNGASFDPSGAEVDAAFKHVLARAKAAGKFCGAFAISPAKAGARQAGFPARHRFGRFRPDPGGGEERARRRARQVKKKAGGEGSRTGRLIGILEVCR